jgi:hypothetical protein
MASRLVKWYFLLLQHVVLIIASIHYRNSIRRRSKLKRRRMFESIILIHNFRTHLLGCNQISAVFDSEYERVITLQGHDRIARYYNYDYEVE